MVNITSSDEKTSGFGCDPEGWGTFLRCQKNVTGLIVLRGMFFPEEGPHDVAALRY